MDILNIDFVKLPILRYYLNLCKFAVITFGKTFSLDINLSSILEKEEK